MRRVILAAFVLAVCIPAAAQTDDADSKLELGQVRSLRERAETDTALSEEPRARVVALYDDAIGALETAKSRKDGDDKKPEPKKHPAGGLRNPRTDGTTVKSARDNMMERNRTAWQGRKPAESN